METISAPVKRRARRKVVTIILGLILFIGSLLGLRGLWWEPSSLTVSRQTIRLASWPANFNGLKIVAVSDLHVGSPFMTLDKMRRIVELVNAEQPDLIVMLGDYVIQDVVGGRFVAPEEFAPVLGNLRAKQGVYVVLGNHDWDLDGPRVRRAFEGAGLRVLANEAVRVGRGEAGVWIAGIDDFWSQHQDIEATLRQVKSAEPIIALNHSPDIFPELPARVALTLCGHTHGGQVNLPFLRDLAVPSRYGARYRSGLIGKEGHQLFVTTGVGTSILPIRLRVIPEIAALTIEGK